MARVNISSGSDWEAQISYSRAVVCGQFVFVSGTTGYDYKTGSISPSIADQTEQAMRNIQAALTEAGCEIRDVVRVRYILPRRETFREAWPVLRKWFGEAPPAATMVVAGLMEEEMGIEIEVTALRAG